MRIGTLVRMIDDPQNVLGVITKVVPHVNHPKAIYYRVVWLDDLYDPCYFDDTGLEVLCE